MSIKVLCPRCGEVELPGRAIEMTTYPLMPSLDFYEFDCTRCYTLVHWSADRSTVGALRGQVREIKIALPAELFDPKRDSKVSLTYDDLLDFWQALQTTNELAGPVCSCVSCTEASLPR